MPLSLRQAAVETGVAKSTIQRAINSGKLSAARTDGGGYAIDPAELFRVYPPGRPEPGPMGRDAPAADPLTDALVTELRAQLARMDRVLEDMRGDRDRWHAEAIDWKAQAQRMLPPPMPAPTEPAGRLRRAWRWMRKTG
jgi:excisionase family DNA binding protein